MLTPRKSAHAPVLPSGQVQDKTPSEGSILRFVFFALVAGSMTMLGFDLTNMMRAYNDAIDFERTGPVEMEPPKDKDQNRPYFPRAMPQAPGGRPPALPGLTNRPSPEQLAGRMTFRSDEDGNVSAIGRIEPGTASDFERYLAEQKNAKKVYLHSPGGSVSDAIATPIAHRLARSCSPVERNDQRARTFG